MSVDPWDYPGLRVLKIAVPSGDPYYIDFHDDTGVDEHRRDQDKLKAGVNRWSGVEGPAQENSQEYIGRIGDGETFIDADATFKLEVTDISEGAIKEMTIQVTFLPSGVLAYQETN
jgi:hypothetical protein